MHPATPSQETGFTSGYWSLCSCPCPRVPERTDSEESR